LSIKILEAGILDTVQDEGRFGYAALGINTSGVMDNVAALVANYLVGNDASEAVIELHFPSSSFQFDKPALIAFSGADFAPSVNGELIPINHPVLLPQSSVLELTKIVKGARCYLSIRGGLKLNKWLGRHSTNLKANAGGYKGRGLQKGDEMEMTSSYSKEVQLTILPWHADIAKLYRNDNVIRIVKGNEFDKLTDCSGTILDGNSFSISTQSDRMGFRMNGSPLKLNDSQDMISSAVTKGTIQLLPNGQLIILMADHQTTGGYPRIAHVVSADIPTLAQLQPNSNIRFQLISIQEAESLLLKQHRHLQQLQNACNFRLHEYLQQHALY
jgi:antagonist of KipI